jgi:GTPase Era involved in 16S rRNA processing
MSVLKSLRDSVVGWFSFGGAEPQNIGIYGPPNTGKTTLANRIVQDVNSEEEVSNVGSESQVPHETRKANRQKEVEIEHSGDSVTLHIVDTPGVATTVDYEEFQEYNIEKEDAVERSREATEGIAEAMHWLKEDIEGVIYVLDSTRDPFTQVNTMLTGIIESQELPILIFANKIDLEESNVERINNAFPQHTVVPLSAKDGDNMETVYKEIAEKFG